MVRCGIALISLWSVVTLIPLTSTVAAKNENVTAPIVDLGYAKYQGYLDTETNITSFLSIRYAAPPVGNLRFQAPRPAVRQSGVQPATENPNMCHQSSAGTALVSPYRSDRRQATMPAASEDCLFLNVFVPGTIPASPVVAGGLPVLFWIHGGGYQYGYAAQYDGVDLVVDSLNTVIVVVIQYRLGAFGFLSGSEMKTRGTLNPGLLDQNFALKWVQDHIGLFGGDKNHVTIWGESAGAGSVLQHIVAHGGNTRPPLFHAAMVSSLALPPQYHYNDRLPQLLYNDVVDMTGCGSSVDRFKCLQYVDVEMLQTANAALSTSAFYGTFIFVPVVDGTFIRERPTVTLSKRRVNGQVLLAVSNQNEGNFFINPNETLSLIDYLSQFFPDMTFPQLQEAAFVYQNYGTAREQADVAIGDSVLVCPTYYLLQTFCGRSWKGLFAIPPAYHAQDAIYYFNSPSAPPPYDDRQFVAAFSQSFMSVAKYYDVNVKLDPDNITPFWDMYDVGETEMSFNRTDAGVPVVTPINTDPAIRERCAFWSSVTDATAQ